LSASAELLVFNWQASSAGVVDCAILVRYAVESSQKTANAAQFAMTPWYREPVELE